MFLFLSLLCRQKGVNMKIKLIMALLCIAALALAGCTSQVSEKYDSSAGDAAAGEPIDDLDFGDSLEEFDDFDELDSELEDVDFSEVEDLDLG
jgi:hypothetical protein